MIQDIKPLQIGDAVAIVAPCGLRTPEEADVAAHTAGELHLVPVIFPSCKMKPTRVSFEDAARADDLNNAFTDARIRAIWAVGCDAGAFRLMPRLRLSTTAMHPKLFCAPMGAGALHLAYNRFSRLMTLQTPELGVKPWSRMNIDTQAGLKDALFGCAESEWSNPKGAPLTTLAQGKCAGPLIGGDVADVCATLGTPYQIRVKDHILVLDSDSRTLSELDKMFVQLKHASVFSDCAGVLLGSFSGCESAIQQIVRDLLLDEGKPVLFGALLRGADACATLPMGAIAQMDATKQILKFVHRATQKDIISG